MAKMSSSTFTNTSPNWNKTGTEPPSSMKTNGFKAGYKPPAGYFNWFWTKVSKCITEIQNKINSIVSFLSADDFSLYRDVGACTSVSQITALATNTTYKDGNYTLILNVAEGATVTFGLTTSETAHMTFWDGIPILHFSKSNKTYKYVSNSWTRVYADADLSNYYSKSQTYSKTEVDGKIRKEEHAFLNKTLANSTTLRTNIVNNQDTIGRLYMSGTDFIEYVDLESTASVEVLDFIEVTSGGSGVEVQWLDEPTNTYLIQTWHKADGSIIQRIKIGSGSWSAWTS